MDSSMCSSTPDLEILLLRMIDGMIQMRSNIDLTFYSLVGSGRSQGDHHGSSLPREPISLSLMNNPKRRDSIVGCCTQISCVQFANAYLILVIGKNLLFSTFKYSTPHT
ncbi:hypothetical protein CIPAW_14G028800 [Carya illinoinensis]|uniref:Uncharacterized protein ycf68 n=1 Tax=Carya illinoinensis TaxID=32201 RepID=A0A8T1NE67_CARIL|nr:hypothetical protein CIPAW_14G028800 [Carya illinoinensis]